MVTGIAGRRASEHLCIPCLWRAVRSEQQDCLVASVPLRTAARESVMYGGLHLTPFGIWYGMVHKRECLRGKHCRRCMNLPEGIYCTVLMGGCKMGVTGRLTAHASRLEGVQCRGMHAAEC